MTTTATGRRTITARSEITSCSSSTSLKRRPPGRRFNVCGPAPVARRQPHTAGRRVANSPAAVTLHLSRQRLPWHRVVLDEPGQLQARVEQRRDEFAEPVVPLVRHVVRERRLSVSTYVPALVPDRRLLAARNRGTRRRAGPAGRRSCRSRVRPESARRPCSIIPAEIPAWMRPAPAVHPGQRRGDRGTARLRRGRATRALDRPPPRPLRTARPLIRSRSARQMLPASSVEDPVTVGASLLESLDRLGGAPCLALDDAHWADRPSLQALIFALRRLTADQVLMIIAVRDDRASRTCRTACAGWSAGQRGTVLRLRGLDEQDLRDLAAAMGIEGIGASAARRLRYGTQGNPLHARALLEEFPRPPDGPWGADDQPLPSPLSFRRLVQERYAIVGAGDPPADRRGRGARGALPVAAGRGARRASPTRSSRSTRPRGSICCGCRRRQSPWTLSFPHPLVRAAVYEALGPARRHALHTAAASSDRRRIGGAAASGGGGRRAG